MEVYSIGFTKKTAEQFFGALGKAGIRRVLDVRLKNASQLSGFSKRDDLQYFLRELCAAEYLHEPQLAPTAGMLADYKKHKGSWEEYERKFLALLAERKVEEKLSSAIFEVPTALLCSELKPDRCHRRLVLEYLQEKWSNLTIQHL